MLNISPSAPAIKQINNKNNIINEFNNQDYIYIKQPEKLNRNYSNKDVFYTNRNDN